MGRSRHVLYHEDWFIFCSFSFGQMNQSTSFPSSFIFVHFLKCTFRVSYSLTYPWVVFLWPCHKWRVWLWLCCPLHPRSLRSKPKRPNSSSLEYCHGKCKKRKKIGKWGNGKWENGDLLMFLDQYDCWYFCTLYMAVQLSSVKFIILMSDNITDKPKSLKSSLILIPFANYGGTFTWHCSCSYFS